jgi:hypothetical protein
MYLDKMNPCVIHKYQTQELYFMELSSSGFCGFGIFKIVGHGRFLSPYHIGEGLIIVRSCMILSLVFIDSLDFASSVEAKQDCPQI